MYLNTNSAGKKIKILHFTISNTGGGITKFILRLWKYIDKDRFSFDFVTMSNYLDYAEQLEKEGCKIYYLSVYAEEDKERFAKEVNSILENGYDVVHLHTNWWRGFWLEKLAQKKGISKIIVHAHSTGVHIKEEQSREAANKLHYEQREMLTDEIATDFLACSKEAAEWLYKDKIPWEKIRIIPGAVKLDKFKFNVSIRTEYRMKLGIQTGDFVIGHIGRFAYEKNHEFLLEIFYDIAMRDENAKLLLIGVGELESSIRTKAQKYGLKDKVLFLGKREDVNCLLQVMDVFAFPSFYEGYGLVLIEAQAAGLKCIVSNTVPRITKVTDDVEYLELNKEMWVEKLSKISCGYERKDTSHILDAAGYGMETMVKTFEEIYSGE